MGFYAQMFKGIHLTCNQEKGKPFRVLSERTYLNSFKGDMKNYVTEVTCMKISR